MKAIIIGASSGIGRELAKVMSSAGYVLGITGRRTDKLESLKSELDNRSTVCEMDLLDPDASLTAFDQLLQTLGDVDLVVINSGVGYIDKTWPIDQELETVAVNVAGFSAIANRAYHYFSKRGHGHIVGISSLAAVRGGPVATYNASKAYVSSYLEGLACRFHGEGKAVSVTDVRPGFVDTAMAQGDGLFWVASVEKAAQQIFSAIEKRKRVVYITKRWQVVSWLLKVLPHFLYRRVMS